MEVISIFTDGSSRGNPGPGGFGAILKYKSNYKEISQGFRRTTNNRMELLAIIVALENLKSNEIPVHVYSDSKYVIDSIEKKWIHSWLKTNFKGKKNKDLWLRYLQASKNLNLTFHWVKGHNGHIENERCDTLAVEAALNSPKEIDVEFEKSEAELF